MGTALKVVEMLGKIGRVIVEGVEAGHSNAQIRANIDEIVNDEELNAAKRAAKRVKDYLSKLPED